jgi:hypothetical protein
VSGLFRYEHREIEISRGIHTGLTKQDRAAVGELLKMPLTVAEQRLLQAGLLGVLPMIHGLKRHLDALVVPFPRERPYGRAFWRAIYLWRLYSAVRDQSHISRWWKPIIGAMIQQELGEFLLHMGPRAWRQIYWLDHASQSLLIETDFFAHLAGAQYSTRIVLDLKRRANCRMFYPTIYEDIRYGIDLFWVEDDWRATVSVKGDRDQRGIHAFDASRNDGKHSLSSTNVNIRHVRAGTATLNQITGADWVPVLVQIGRKSSRPRGETSRALEPSWHEQLIERTQRRLNRKAMA